MSLAEQEQSQEQHEEEYQYQSEADGRDERPEYDCNWCEDRSDDCNCQSKAKKARLRISQSYASERLRDGELNGKYGPFQAAMMAAHAECDTKHPPFSTQWLAELKQHTTFRHWEAWCWNPTHSISPW